MSLPPPSHNLPDLFIFGWIGQQPSRVLGIDHHPERGPLAHPPAPLLVGQHSQFCPDADDMLLIFSKALEDIAYQFVLGIVLPGALAGDAADVPLFFPYCPLDQVRQIDRPGQPVQPVNDQDIALLYGVNGFP